MWKISCYLCNQSNLVSGQKQESSKYSRRDLCTLISVCDIGLRYIQIYGYNKHLLGIGLIWCPFRRITMVGNSLGPMTCLATDSWPDSGARFLLVKWDLNPTRKWLVTPVVFMTLRHWWALWWGHMLLRLARFTPEWYWWSRFSSHNMRASQ